VNRKRRVRSVLLQKKSGVDALGGRRNTSASKIQFGRDHQKGERGAVEEEETLNEQEGGSGHAPSEKVIGKSF